MLFSYKDVDLNPLNCNLGLKFWFQICFLCFIFPLTVSQLLPVQQHISLAALKGSKVSGLAKARDSLTTVIKLTNKSENYAGPGGEVEKSPKNKGGKITRLIKSDWRAKCWNTTRWRDFSGGGALEPCFSFFLSSISESISFNRDLDKHAIQPHLMPHFWFLVILSSGAVLYKESVHTPVYSRGSEYPPYKKNSVDSEVCL